MRCLASFNTRLARPRTHHTAPLRAPTGSSSRRITVCMAQQSEKLDKSTPDSTWKKILSAQEVCVYLQQHQAVHVGLQPTPFRVCWPKESWPACEVCAYCACVCLGSGVQYHILREKGTEPPGSGQYNKFYEKVGGLHVPQTGSRGSRLPCCAPAAGRFFTWGASSSCCTRPTVSCTGWLLTCRAAVPPLPCCLLLRALTSALAAAHPFTSTCTALWAGERACMQRRSTGARWHTTSTKHPAWGLAVVLTQTQLLPEANNPASKAVGSCCCQLVPAAAAAGPTQSSTLAAAGQHSTTTLREQLTGTRTVPLAWCALRSHAPTVERTWAMCLRQVDPLPRISV